MSSCQLESKPWRRGRTASFVDRLDQANAVSAYFTLVLDPIAPKFARVESLTQGLFRNSIEDVVQCYFI